MTAQWDTNLSASRAQRLERSLNDSSAGSVLLQTFITRKVQELTNREQGVWTSLDHRPGSGDAAYINRRTAGATGGSWVADTDTLVEETGTYAQTSFAYKTAATRGTVTRFLQRTGMSYADVLDLELRMKAGDDFPNLLEEAAVQGDVVANTKQPSGLLTLINAVGTQSLLQDNGSGAFQVPGYDLTTEKMDQLVDTVRGSNGDKILFASRLGRRKLNALLQANRRYTEDRIEIRGGFRVQTYDDIPIVTSTQIPDTLLPNTSDLTARNIAAFTGGVTTAIICVNREDVYFEDLTPVTVEPLAKTTSQNDSFDLYWDGVLAYANTLAGAVLAGITTS